MGAGFQISMRDLEIRGAGNLLGSQQSGHIATIGYELVLPTARDGRSSLEAHAVENAGPRRSRFAVAAYLPDDYVNYRRQKIDLYRRLTRMERFDQVDEIAAELRDRFGKIPPPAKRLIKVANLRLEAALWQI